MEQEEKKRLEREAEEELKRQFGAGTVQKVEVLQYGDEPVIEPGQVLVRVILTPTGEDPEEALHAFEKAHRAAIEHLRKKVARKMPFIARVQFTLPEQPAIIRRTAAPAVRMVARCPAAVTDRSETHPNATSRSRSMQGCLSVAGG